MKSCNKMLGLIVLCVFSAMGCNNTFMYSPAPASPAVAADDDFDTQPNRPPTAKTLYAVSKVLIAQGKEAEAQALLIKITCQYREFLPAYCDLAEMQIRTVGPDQAIETLSAGLAVVPNDPVLLNNVGMCWLLKGENERALEAFTKAAASAPLEGRYRSNMATALAMMGRQGESFALYRQVLSPSDADFNVGVLCLVGPVKPSSQPVVR